MKSDNRRPGVPKTGRETGRAIPPAPRISTGELMRQQSELIIEHGGREYRLRITHSGKLILTA
jgi:hemin uptake protein HemP